MRVALLTAGTGGRKLLVGFKQLLGREPMTVIANTGDDFVHLGLYISPDVDSVLYQLSGLLDEERGWGRRGDTFGFLEEVERLGGDTWFRLGDRDLAMHILRTSLLNRGHSLTMVTALLATRLGVSDKVLPMSDDRVQTRIVTDGGEMTFNEFLVRDGAKPQVSGIYYHGSESARPSPGAIEAITAADLVVIGPSNPLAGIGPMVSIRGMREALQRHRAKVVAVSPLIGESAVSGPSARFMEAQGVDASVRGLAGLYSDIVSRIFIHHTDFKHVRLGSKFHLRLIPTDILMRDARDSRRLAEEILGKNGA
jgi:LPPG:FO 2-phospho-L-lactate transferase